MSEISKYDLEIIKKSLDKGNDVLIRAKRDEIQIIEQKPKIIGRIKKNKRCTETAAHNS